MSNLFLIIVHQLTQQNLFGKTQSDLDLEADKIIFEQLKKSGVVHSAASEEKPFVSGIGSTQTFIDQCPQ